MFAGYAGHVGTLGATGRLSNEVVNRAHEPSTLLLELSQYSRERVPGCTKYMPRSVRNIRPAPPAQPMLDEDWAQVQWLRLTELCDAALYQ